MKGTVREESQVFTKSVGFGLFEVVAICPTRDKLNKLLEKEPGENEEEIEYLGKDQDDNDKAKIVIWLKEQKTGKLFAYTMSVIRKPKVNKDATKWQYINNVGETSWTDESESFPQFFTHFLNKDKEVLGDKTYRKAFVGEEELGTFLKAWFRIDTRKPDADLSVDVNKFFNGNFKELQNYVGDGLTQPFVALLGVRTDKDDADKQYQQVYGKAFLPQNFMKYINNGCKFPSSWENKVWNKFKENVEGQYGFQGFTKLEPIQDYDRDEDLSASNVAKTTIDSEGSDY